MIKELENYIEQVALNNQMIASFKKGDQFEIERNGDDKYPLFFLEDSYDISYIDGSKEITLTYYIAELPAQDYFDKSELLNKIEIINDNILQWLKLKKNNVYESITNTKSITDSQWMSDDTVVIITDITFRFKRNMNNCDSTFKEQKILGYND